MGTDKDPSLSRPAGAGGVGLLIVLLIGVFALYLDFSSSRWQARVSEAERRAAQAQDELEACRESRLQMAEELDALERKYSGYEELAGIPFLRVSLNRMKSAVRKAETRARADFVVRLAKLLLDEAKRNDASAEHVSELERLQEAGRLKQEVLEEEAAAAPEPQGEGD